MSPLFFVLFLYFLPTIHGKDTRLQYPLKDFNVRFLHGYSLNFSSPAPHIFSSVHGSLRQGHNTFFPNGFSVAPCEIPAFTPPLPRMAERGAASEPRVAGFYTVRFPVPLSPAIVLKGRSAMSGSHRWDR